VKSQVCQQRFVHRRGSLLGKTVPHGNQARAKRSLTCGSGKKYKKCCLEKDQQAEHAAFAETAARTAAYEAKSKIKLERFKTDVLAHGLKGEEFRKWQSLENRLQRRA